MSECDPGSAESEPTGGVHGLRHRDAIHRRVLILGVTGSGKSTLALTLSEITGLPCHLVDEELGWLPGWVQREPTEMRSLAASLLNSNEWIFDSAYASYRDLAEDRADLIVGLDYSRWVSLWRLVRRTVRRATTGELACNGNRETWRKVFSMDSIIVWHFRSFARKRRVIRAHQAASTNGSGPTTLRFTSPKQLDGWLQSLRRSTPKNRR